MVGGRPFLLRGIEWNHEPFAFLAARGFNAVWLDEPPTREQSAEAARAGLWLIATPPAPEQLTSGGIDPALDRVLAWHLGSPAGPRDLEHTRRWADLVRGHDPLVARPILVTPRGDWLPTSRLADVLVADHAAAGTLSRADFSEWLQALPLLARPGTPFWAQIPTQPGPRTRQQISALIARTSFAADDARRRTDRVVGHGRGNERLPRLFVSIRFPAGRERRRIAAPRDDVGTA